MRLDLLLTGTGIDCPLLWRKIEISGISYDSRKTQKGNAFVCIKGEHTNGHIYAMDAAFRGASVAIAEEELNLMTIPVLITDDSRKALSAMSANFYGHPANQLSLFGITGTNGKTTVSYMIKSGLEADGKACGLIGTISYKIGEKEYESTRTTPESLDLHSIFAKMKEQEIKYCSMEVSSHALKLGRAGDIIFDYGVFTNLTQDHMDFHKDREDYYQSKKKMFDRIAKGAIINIDDESGSRLFHELEGSSFKTVACSLKDKKADYYGELQETSERGSQFTFYREGEALGTLTTQSPGRFTLYNALIAAGCLDLAEIPFQSIQSGLSSLKGVPGRFELIENTKQIPVIVDFAHTPDALEKVLETAAGIAKGRLICVFGCGGDRDRTKRPMMGKAAGKYADHCIVTSDNPRTESQQQISADIEEGLYETGCMYEIIEDRRQAISKVLSMYQSGDLIVISGKGHETYQIIGASRTYFSDQETVRELIEMRGGDKNDRN
jgi:UDP-N-acetylmuramoyl-L-alanyl-D-glutamate--2,6-diaminopimelate ligase